MPPTRQRWVTTASILALSAWVVYGALLFACIVVVGSDYDVKFKLLALLVAASSSYVQGRSDGHIKGFAAGLVHRL